MKQVWITVFAALTFVACNSETPAESAAADSTVTTPTEAPATPVADTNAEIDPVCQMVKDSTWTDYTVNGTDTVWFCSETCKTAYTANPAKYQSKS